MAHKGETHTEEKRRKGYFRQDRHCFPREVEQLEGMLLNLAPHSRRRRRLALDACPNPFLLPPQPVASHAYNVWRGEGGAAIRALKGSGRKREGVASQVTSIPHSLASKNVSKQVAEEEGAMCVGCGGGKY